MSVDGGGHATVSTYVVVSLEIEAEDCSVYSTGVSGSDAQVKVQSGHILFLSLEIRCLFLAMVEDLVVTSN